MAGEALYVPLCNNSDPNSNCEPYATKHPFLKMIAAAFSPQSKETLVTAVNECIKMSPIGDCSEGPHGPIGDWDVSAVTDMDKIFYLDSAFNQDLSKWDVSAVTNMASMFSVACAFNQDLSKWDVSTVTDT